MSDCEHVWKMNNIEFGFIAFEKCSHCQTVRTHFAIDEGSGDDYREGECVWNRVENAQSFRFDLVCTECSLTVKYRDLMGLLYCTSCMEDCEVERIQKECAAKKTWILVAFGFLPTDKDKPFPPHKLEILTDYFNQRRDTSRSRMKIVSHDLIEKFSLCKGEFIHDRGMLSLEAQEERKPLL